VSGRRLIEVAFPLKQASLDSVHEKNVRHGHISTLHIWPARRPLAASRAALIATLLPDPGTPEERRKLIEKIGGKVIQKTEQKKTPTKTVDVLREETIGGVLHWGREASPDLEWFRQEILKAYGGRAPRVLDPFAGGGAIPLEAMRLGCEVTAADINPVAWFILKCSLEYPQRLAGQHFPLPTFAVESPEFMEAFLKGTSKPTKKQLQRQLEAVQQSLFPPPDVDLAWHVRAWGFWVLQQARESLERFYPVVEGVPTVAYLWARTVVCKNCRATIPLLKTRWLCKKADKRVLLKMEPNADRSSVSFGIDENVPVVGGNPAQRREHDRRIGEGTMSKAGAWCPCCGQARTVSMALADIRQEGLAGRIGAMITAVVVDAGAGKAYRPATTQEALLAAETATEIAATFSGIPFGIPDEAIPQGGSRSSGGSPFTTHLYGVAKWSQLFTTRQLLGMGVFAQQTRHLRAAMASSRYPPGWIDAVQSYLACAIGRLADYNSTVCLWGVSRETIAHTFTRFAIPMTWDFCETNPILHGTGSYDGGVDWVARYVEHALDALKGAVAPTILRQDVSRLSQRDGPAWDAVVTDPPYYDVIPYSDLADFFLVWLRRVLRGAGPEFDKQLADPCGPKWDEQSGEGELIDDASRFGGDATRSRSAYEEGMRRAFGRCLASLRPEGKLFVVFANKQPAAWEALVGALVSAGATVTASWPIVTEMRGGVRNFGRASLASSVWLVCAKRPESARVGWDNRVLDDMRASIHTCLRDYWDAGRVWTSCWTFSRMFTPLALADSGGGG
jgi:adenine-specific DNA methylase